MSSLLSPESQSLFPLEKISDLETLFENECLKSEPNLALLSIILGAIEHSLVQLDYSLEDLNQYNQISHKGQGRNAGTASATGEVLSETPLLVTPPVSSRRKGKGRTSRKSGAAQKKVAVDFKHAKDGQPAGSKNGSKVNGDEGNQISGEEEHTSLNLKDVEDSKTEDESRFQVSSEGAQQNGNMKDVIEDKASKRSRGDFPPLEIEEVEALYLKFKQMLVSMVDLNEYLNKSGEDGNDEKQDVKGTPKELVKRVSDVVWFHLSRTYKPDAPHIQSLYTYLFYKKLDSFGVALAVAAGCQILGLNDVHLALSEDHAWIVFGAEGEHTAEVTWHGKGIEDKRGQPVRLGDDENSWLYLKGNAIHCTRHMEAAAIVASINFNINVSLNSLELIQIQQLLLWKLYDAGHLEKYPMALSCLAELEEIRPLPKRKPCITLFREAVLAARTYYNDMHIYPYTNYAGYLFRQQDYKAALKYWADAARVIQKYTRSKNDEEIYREFFEISTDYLMTVMKQSSTGFSAHSIMRDPCSFAQLLRFFDGICMWEEHSRIPIVHSTWAGAWVNAIGKFDYTIRRLVHVTLGSSDGEEKENSKLHMERSPENPDDDHEKGKLIGKPEKKRIRRSSRKLSLNSGIDEDEVPKPAVTLRSDKLQQLKDLLKREKYNPKNMALLLTAQSATGSASSSCNKPAVSEAGTTSSRPRRERLSQNVESSSERTAKSPTINPPPRKRTKLDM